MVIRDRQFDLLRGRDMLCFSHNWDADPLSKTHLMRALSRDNRVLWINSIGYRTPTLSRYDVARAIRQVASAAVPLREPERNIHVLNPLVIPVYGRRWVMELNRRLLRHQVRSAMDKLGFNRPINWVFNPTAEMAAGSLGEETLIYYCVDEFAAFSGVCSESVRRMERDLIAKSDLVFVSSSELYEKKAPLHPRTALIRHGVDWSHFRRALNPQTIVPDDLAALPGPIIGYFGLIGRDWVDLQLIAHLARTLPHASIVMIGNVTMDVSPIKGLANVHLMGHRPYQELPNYCRGFDVAMIPFPINEVTLNSNPLKCREYLAAGLPVISTAIPEVEVLDCCRIGRDPKEFVAYVVAALRDPGPSLQRSDAIRGQSWEAKLIEISAHLAAVSEERRPESRFIAAISPRFRPARTLVQHGASAALNHVGSDQGWGSAATSRSNCSRVL